MDTECIYDSDVRETRVRGLQHANEKLEEELEAAKLLLRQVATGPDHMRSLVVEYLEDSKQPSEIIQLLKVGGGFDSPVAKVENMEDPSGHRNGILPVHPSAADDTEFVKEEGSFVQVEQSIHEGRDYNSMESTTPDSSYMHYSMLYSSQHTSSTSSTPIVPEYTTTWEDDVRCRAPESTELAGSQPQILLSTDSLGGEFKYATHATNHQGPMDFQTTSRSLFFEPLFDRTDYLLTATSAFTSIQQETDRDDDHEGVSPQDSQPLSPHGHPIVDFHGTPGPNLNHSSQPESTTPIQTTSERLAWSLRVHPNYRNNFGNLSLSNSVQANGFPRHIQDIQIRNIFVPNWAVTMLNTKPDPGGLEDAFGDIFKKATQLLQRGEPLSSVIGPHPNIAALYDQAEFDKSCLLSQWAARMVHSVKLQGYDFTCFASMNIFWFLMRWMIDPSPDTYAAIPEWIRPTSNQLFTPHISMADFVLWPALRELIVQLPEMQERMGWLADMSMFIKCDWPYELEQALHRNPTTGLVDLVDLAKV
ncbi:hypothetical protein FSARC_11542 [Fusarium sarcochroum]|uniref:BZIP transcription factor n=1 Tax=Fusarium sarcochroum TaxID=1208366 RepID=A0A8H4X094_9HYPO|nr:hypothetical protein FSARC_11542 [Fusarium sarcochroum]